MPGTEWPFTQLGRTFFDGTLPRIARALERIAKMLEDRHEEVLKKLQSSSSYWKYWSKETVLLARSDLTLSPEEVVEKILTQMLDADRQHREDVEKNG